MDNKDLYNEFLDNEYRLKNYVSYYIESVSKPNMITVENIDQKLCLKWIEKNLKDRIIKKSFHRFSDNPIYEEVSYLISGNILIHVHSDIFIDILFFEEQQEKIAQEIADELERFKKVT